MITINRTNADDPDFRTLVTLLDQDLAIRDGDDHAFFATFNTLDKIKYAVVAYDGQTPVGCGAIRAYTDDTMEVKRMFVQPEYRGQGIGAQVLAALETWSVELGYSRCRLETGTRQPEAIQLYHKSGYDIIPNYGQYALVETSVCFEKSLTLP
jgi:putative acetyltransferase